LPNEKIYSKSFDAINNIVNVRGELQEQLDELINKERIIDTKKRKVNKVIKDIDSIFPNAKESDLLHTRNVINHLKNFEIEKTKNGKPKGKNRSSTVSKGMAIGIITGVLFSAVVGTILWKGIGNRSKRRSRTNDALFIDQITRYLQENA
jgi:ribosomal protein L17